MWLPICWLLGHRKEQEEPYEHQLDTFNKRVVEHYRCARCHGLVFEEREPRKVKTSFSYRKFDDSQKVDEDVE